MLYEALLPHFFWQSAPEQWHLQSDILTVNVVLRGALKLSLTLAS